MALHCIDAGIDRDDWVKALTAFKAAGGDESTARTWSESGNNYDARAFNDTWRSIKANGGIGPGTLFHLAKAHGWSDNGHKPDFAEIERQRQAREAAAAAEAEATRQAQERTAGIAAQLWQWDIYAYVRNLTNKDYINLAQAYQGGQNMVIFGEPRRFGIGTRYSF